MIRISKDTRKEWRRLANCGMDSALGEYTPRTEFIALLDYVDALEEFIRKSELQFCGHHLDSVVSSDEGTHYCRECEESKWQKIK